MTDAIAPIIGSLPVQLFVRSQQAGAEVSVADIELPLRGFVRDPDGERVTVDIDVSVDAVTDALLHLLPSNPEAPDLDEAPDIGRLLLGLLEQRAEAYVTRITRGEYPAVRDLAITDGWAILAVAIAAFGVDPVLGDGYSDGTYLLRLGAAQRVLNLITGA